MTPLTTERLCALTGGQLIIGVHRPLGPASLDTRTLREGDTFYCLRGPNFDGHAFAGAAIAAGAATVVMDRRGATRLPEGPLDADVAVVVVDDVVAALSRLAAAHRVGFPGEVIGLTGSSGKTTTKEMIAAVVSVVGPTLCTLGNQNNHLGVPLTLLRLSETHRFAVVEMGMNAPGEITWLAALAQPRVGVVTTVGAAHLERLGSLRNIARAKGELFDALPDDGLGVTVSHVPWPWVLTSGLRAPLLVVGERAVDEVRLSGARELKDGAAGFVTVDGQRHWLRLRLSGRHNLHNALLAIAVGRELGVPVADAIDALATVPPAHLRGEVKYLPDGRAVVLDCYNANPQSMAAALDTFVRRAPGGVLVLGDMLELGESADAAHAELGRRVAALPGAPMLLAVGPLGVHTIAAARIAGLPAARAHHVADADAAAALLRDDDRAILLKGSRGMRLERVFAALAGGREA